MSALDLAFESADAGGLRDRYLSGFPGRLGMADVALSGALDGAIRHAGGRLHRADARLHGVDVNDPRGRFLLRGLEGSLAFSGAEPVDSELRWTQARMYGLDSARRPCRSAAQMAS